MRELKIARKSRGLSQLDLSVLSGCSQSNISKIERGVCSPTLTTLRRLADVMDMKLVIEFKEKTDEEDAGN